MIRRQDIQGGAAAAAKQAGFRGNFSTLRTGVESIVVQTRADRQRFVSEFLKALKLPSNGKSREIAEIFGGISNDDVFGFYARIVARRLGNGLDRTHADCLELRKAEYCAWNVFINAKDGQKGSFSRQLEAAFLKAGNADDVIRLASEISQKNGFKAD